MRKKFFLLAVLFCLLTVLAACNQHETGFSSAPTTTALATMESTAATASIPAAATEAPTDAEAAEWNAAIRGSWEGEVYTNQGLGFRMALPEGLLRFNDYQLAQNNGLLSENYMKTDTAELVRTIGNLSVMAMTDYHGANAYLTLIPAHPEVDSYSEEVLLESIVEQIKGRETPPKSIEILQLQLEGKEKTALHMIQQQNGAETELYQFLLRNDDTLMGILTICPTEDRDIQNFLEGVSLFEPAP